MQNTFCTSLTRTEKVVFAVSIVLLCLSLYSHFILGNVSADKDLELYNAHTWLQGKPLYQGIFGVQPPLIYSIYTLPVYLSQHLGILQDSHYLLLLGLILMAYIAYTALMLIRHHPAFAQDTKKQAEFCLLLVSIFITFQNPQYIFDREHLFLVLTFPYVLRFMPSMAHAKISIRTSILIGIMAALGSCFKPQCLVVFAGVNLFYLLRERSFAIIRSGENITFYLVVIMCIMLTGVFTPLYLTVVIPMALATYSACKSSLGGLVYFLSALLTFGVTFADYRLRHKSPYRSDILYLVAVAGLFLIYGVATYGWGYSWNPLSSMVNILTGFVLWDYLYLKQEHEKNGLPVKPFIFGIRACTACFLYNAAFTLTYFGFALNLLYFGYGIDCYGSASLCTTQKQFVAEIEKANDQQPVRSFEALSIGFDPTWLVYNRLTDAQWESRFNLWMLAKFFIAGKDFAIRHKWVLDYTDHALADNLRKNKPQLVFVSDSDGFFAYNKNVDLVAFLETLPEFAHEWKHYRYVTKIDTLYPELQGRKQHGFFVYKRID